MARPATHMLVGEGLWSMLLCGFPTRGLRWTRNPPEVTCGRCLKLTWLVGNDALLSARAGGSGRPTSHEAR